MSTILILMPVEPEVQARESAYALDPPASKRNENVHCDERNLPGHVSAALRLLGGEREKGNITRCFFANDPRRIASRGAVVREIAKSS